jgi:parallel beta-helix repeat protein
MMVQEEDFSRYGTFFSKNTACSAIECINLSGEFYVSENQFLNCGFEPFYSPDPKLVRVPLAIYLNYGNKGKIFISKNSFVKDATEPLAGGIMLSAQTGNYHSAIISDNYFERVGLSNENHSGVVDLYNFIHRATITGNIFHNLTYAAIKVANSSDIVIANNVISQDNQMAEIKSPAIIHMGCGLCKI